MVPVSAVPLINRCRAHRTLLQNGCHIACGAGDIVIRHHRWPHWLKRSVGRVSPVRRDSGSITLGKNTQTITSLEISAAMLNIKPLALYNTFSIPKLNGYNSSTA